MRIDDLKTWLLSNLGTAITSRSTVPVPLTMFTSGEIVLRDYVEPTTQKLLYLDPQEDEIEAGTNYSRWVTERINAYVIVTRGSSESVMRDQAEQYTLALLDAIEGHPDYMSTESRESYNGVEGKPDSKASKVTLVFKYEE